VCIIDEFTGRAMPDRAWENGLHQLIELKEGCVPSAPRGTVARISYQRFFRRYLRLAGMSGTAREVAPELRAVYGLDVVAVPPRRPSRRRALPGRVYARGEERWQAVLARVRELHARGRPVLVGTRSVAAAEHLAALLSRTGLAHQVLSARQDRAEAAVIARAGEAGRITIATNMAGRGTDIRLGAGVAARGGLHVIVTEHHEAARIDRQLCGRCARQGDPGSHEAIVSLEDELIRRYASRLAALARRAAQPKRPLPRPLGRLVWRSAQHRAERRHAGLRRELLKMDRKLPTLLAFAGSME